MSTIAETVDDTAYASLLSETLPHVIHTEQENERYTRILEDILAKPELTAEEERLQELLTLLIEDFEGRHYALPGQATPRDVVRHLMKSNGLRQTDMIDVFGSTSVVSEVLSGKRDLSKTHIARLSERFHISPAVFFTAKAG